MNILNQQVQSVQFVTVDDDCPAYRWGFEDGMEGHSEFTGYDYFVGWRLQAYLEGHRAGLTMRQMLQGTVLDEVRRVLQPQADTRLWGGDPTFAAWEADGAPLAGFAWDGDYSGVTEASDREDWIG